MFGSVDKAIETDTLASIQVQIGGTIGLRWIGVDWTELDWTGLDWIGSDWIESNRIGLKFRKTTTACRWSTSYQ